MQSRPPDQRHRRRGLRRADRDSQAAVPSAFSVFKKFCFQKVFWFPHWQFLSPHLIIGLVFLITSSDGCLRRVFQTFFPPNPHASYRESSKNAIVPFSTSAVDDSAREVSV